MKFSDSLKKKQDFQQVYKKGTSVANRYLVMYVLPNGSKENRLGISVSKKVGNSVVRHRITRLIRESYRLNEERFLPGMDIIVSARPTASAIDFHSVQKGLLYLAAKTK
ncbi:MAG: ribonuclease P protein component, partial [Blautia sp.]|nr:ribonuclease P protein component [Blautia sp.]